jgi:superfamily II DNA or RNA helicase
MTKREINKNKIQDYAVYLSTKFKHVVLQWATGCGKSLAAIKIIDNDIKTSTEEKGEWNRWCIVVAERQHIKNWELDIHKHGYSYLLDLGYVDIFCYQSLHKHKNKEANLVLDEAHSVTDLRLDCLTTIKASKIVSLSATLESSREVQLASLSPFHKYTVTTDQAIKADLLPPPIIVKMELDLSPTLRLAYDTLTADIRAQDELLYSQKTQVEEIIKVFPTSPKIGEIRSQIIAGEANSMKLRVRRKNLVANSKSSSVERLQTVIRNWKKKYIIFTGNLAQNKRFCKKDPAKCLDISSDHSTKTVEARVGYFNDYPKDNDIGLVCYKMLRQGTNLEGIQMGIITQLDSKQLSFTQMMGRVFRSERPVLFVFTVRNTIDDVYWEECSKDLDKSYIISYQEYINKYGKME